MPQVKIRAVRWVSDDPQPGIVECRLLDADGTEHVLIDKCAVFDYGDLLTPTAVYPIDLVFDCRVVEDAAAAVTIELAWNVESEDGQTTFRVNRSSLV